MEEFKRTVVEKPGKNLVCEFEYKMRKTTKGWRSDLILEDTKEYKIWIVDMVCTAEANVAQKRKEKLQKCQQ